MHTRARDVFRVYMIIRLILEHITGFMACVWLIHWFIIGFLIAIFRAESANVCANYKTTQRCTELFMYTKKLRDLIHTQYTHYIPSPIYSTTYRECVFDFVWFYRAQRETHNVFSHNGMVNVWCWSYNMWIEECVYW